MWIELLGQYDPVKGIDHVDFLRWSISTGVFVNTDPFGMFLHMKVAHVGNELWLFDLERDFTAKVWEHKVIHNCVPLSSIDMDPLLVA